MTTDNKYSEVLLELKTHYQQTLAELEAQTNQLKTKITSLDTLIEDPLLGSDILSILQGEAGSMPSEASNSKAADTVEPKAESKPKKTAPKAASKKKPTTPKKPASTSKTKGKVESKAEATPKKVTPKASPSSGKRTSPASKKSASAPKDTNKVESKAEEKPKTVAPKASRSSSQKQSSASKKAASQTETKKKNQKKPSQSSSSPLKMNKPYDQMNKTKAIAQILQENPGKVMHTDDLSLILFGKLTPEQHQVERARMKTTMYRGVDQNRWNKVPKKKMCYVYNPSKNVGPTNSDTLKG